MFDRGLRDECLPADSGEVSEGDRRSHRRQRHVCPQRRPEHRGGRLQRLRGASLQTNWKRKIDTIPLSHSVGCHKTRR